MLSFMEGELSDLGSVQGPSIKTTILFKKIVALHVL
jgi:hypothetical protein